ncbi:MAG: Wzz/FepE/Etk N-terminal domain-containing protein [Imperialibacter sp.]|uniref:GumC family protein n=1 Tax=Imperialibacter sp. TaxID=2038411 RepID=UPI0032ED5AED
MNTNKQKSTLQHVFFSEDEGFDFQDILRKILYRWRLIAASLTVFLIISIAANFFIETQFTIKSSILIKQNDKNEKDFFKELDYFETPTSIENEMEILSSYSLLREVVDSLRSNINYYSSDGVRKQYLSRDSSPIILDIVKSSDASEYFNLYIDLTSVDSYKITNEVFGDIKLIQNTFHFGDVVKLGATQFVVLKSNNFDQFLTNEIGIEVENPRQYTIGLVEEIKIKSVSSKSNVVEISLETSDKEHGIEIIDLLVKKYAQRESLIKNAKAVNLVDFIDSQLVSVERKLKELESEFESYRKENKILNITQEGNVLYTTLSQLETQRAKSELNLQYYLYLTNYIENPKLDEILSPSSVGISDPVLNDLITNLNSISYEIVQLKASTSTINPQYKTLETLYFSIVNSIRENVVNLKNATELEIKNLNERISLTESQFKQLPSSEKYLVSIQRNLKLSESLYLYLQEQKAEAEIALASNEMSVVVIDNAIAISQARPKLLLNLSIAIFLGLLLPIFGIVLYDFLTGKVHGIGDIYSASNIPVISTIPFDEDNLEFGKSLSTRESFKRICSFLTMLDNGSNGGKSALFTSRNSGEGKTFCSLNTALSFARSGYKTLLLDLDFPHAKLSEAFSEPNDLGTTNILFEGSNWQEVVKTTNHKNLHFIGKGSVLDSSDLMIWPNNFGEFILSAKAKFDFVIIDASSLNDQADLVMIAQKVDSTFVVIKRKQSSIEDVKQIDKLQDTLKFKNIGFVFNFSTALKA